VPWDFENDNWVWGEPLYPLFDLDGNQDMLDNVSHGNQEGLEMNEDILKRDIEDILTGVTITSVPGRTHICVVVLDEQKNGSHHDRELVKVRCYHGTAFTQGYPYDQNSDSYLIPCVQSDHLGYIPVAFQISVPDTEWTVPMPVPESVIQRHLTELQKTHLKAVRKKFSDERYKVILVQMSGCEV
jgi:hypothetical protein